MDPRRQELAARIAGRRGGVRGPLRVWLHSPEMCERAESLGAFARFDSSLPKHLSELTLLMAARNWDAQYSWNAHVHQAIEAGIPEAAVKAIAEKREAVFDNEADQAFYQFCREILDDHFVTDATFAAALEHFGSKRPSSTPSARSATSPCSACASTRSRWTSRPTRNPRSRTSAATKPDRPGRRRRHRATPVTTPGETRYFASGASPRASGGAAALKGAWTSTCTRGEVHALMVHEPRRQVDCWYRSFRGSTSPERQAPSRSTGRRRRTDLRSARPAGSASFLGAPAPPNWRWGSPSPRTPCWATCSTRAGVVRVVLRLVNLRGLARHSRASASTSGRRPAPRARSPSPNRPWSRWPARLRRGGRILAVLDEPTACPAPEAAHQIRELVRTLREEAWPSSTSRTTSSRGAGRRRPCDGAAGRSGRGRSALRRRVRRRRTRTGAWGGKVIASSPSGPNGPPPSDEIGLTVRGLTDFGRGRTGLHRRRPQGRGRRRARPSAGTRSHAFLDLLSGRRRPDTGRLAVDGTPRAVRPSSRLSRQRAGAASPATAGPWGSSPNSPWTRT
ncbi:hypothetical protein ACRAWF_21315 [Streptomyces sp. L7]